MQPWHEQPIQQMDTVAWLRKRMRPSSWPRRTKESQWKRKQSSASCKPRMKSGGRHTGTSATRTFGTWSPPRWTAGPKERQQSQRLLNMENHLGTQEPMTELEQQQQQAAAAPPNSQPPKPPTVSAGFLITNFVCCHASNILALKSSFFCSQKNQWLPQPSPMVDDPGKRAKKMNKERESKKRGRTHKKEGAPRTKDKKGIYELCI